MSAHSFEVELLGQKINLKTENDQAFVDEIASLVRLKIKEAANRSGGSPAHEVALLALFDLAEDYLRAKKRAARHRQEISQKSEELVQTIESELK